MTGGDYAGKPTSLKPRPRPAPCLLVTPMLGLTASRMAKTTAARTATVATSSMGRGLRGMKIAAAATARPSIRYLITRLMISATLKSISYIALLEKNYPYSVIRKQSQQQPLRFKGLVEYIRKKKWLPVQARLHLPP